MYTKWSMAELNRNSKKVKKAFFHLTASLIVLSLLSGCSWLPQEEEQEKLPNIRTPKIAQKPEYPVKRGTMELKVSGSGKLMSEREDNLFFTEDSKRILDVYVKAGDRVKKGQLLAELDSGNTESQIRRKEIDLEKAEIDLREALREATEDRSVMIKKQQLDYELLKEDLNELRNQLAGSKLVAPYDGTVVSFTAKKGDVIRAYDKIGQIADLDKLVVAVQFKSADLANIVPGMEALVSINTAGDHAGKVRRLPVSTSPSSGKEESTETYLLIDLTEMPESIGHGTPLSASVIVERRENALTIPLAALRTQNSRNYVLVSHSDGSKGEVDVEIGVKSATDVEIIKGLEEGQKVVGK